jgi:hypothetical protein
VDDRRVVTMPRHRTTSDKDRDIRALGMARAGLTYDQIAGQMNYQDRSGAYRAVQRALRDAFREEASELIQLEAERLNSLRRLFERIAATKHLMASTTGKIALHPETGDPLVDDGPNLQAGLALLRVSESWRKLKGLDAPSRTRTEVITRDMIEEEIARLENELGKQADRSGAG